MWETLWWLVVVPGLLAVLGVYLSWTAGRVDRMNTRVESARAALDAQLQRRAGVTLELAASGLLDPATSLLLADSAHRARAAAGNAAQQLAESDLTGALIAAFDDPADVAQARRTEQQRDEGDETLVDELGESCRRVQLARRFHNDAVRAALALRSHRLVRWGRLAGRAARPEPVDFDDTVPAGLAEALLVADEGAEPASEPHPGG